MRSSLDIPSLLIALGILAFWIFLARRSARLSRNVIVRRLLIWLIVVVAGMFVWNIFFSAH